MRWLVDGMNVIGSRPDGWWRHRARAMADLIDCLKAFRAATGEALTVVFDGKPVELPSRGDEPLQVVFASQGRAGAADEEIVRKVREDDEPSSLCVVTSDAMLAERVRAHGAAVVSSGWFRRRLDALIPK
jgi:predicted RNA-binding protein with PIN domain